MRSDSSERVEVHFLVRDDSGVNVSEANPDVRSRGGRFRAACDPALVIDGRGHRGTNVPQAASCAGCRAAGEFAEAMSRCSGKRVRTAGE